jgi:hypothetical protein
MAKYTVYPGKWVCHTCKVDVPTLRLYPETLEATWMCKDKHLTRVSFAKRKKKDFVKEDKNDSGGIINS